MEIGISSGERLFSTKNKAEMTEKEMVDSSSTSEQEGRWRIIFSSKFTNAEEEVND